MCGIVGTTLGEYHFSDQQFNAMVDALAHRGPDNRGEWKDARVALGHRRLSILDLSNHGAQPMHSPDGNVIIVYNGECYNDLELRKQMPDVDWQSDCDTETILHLYIKRGLKFLDDLVGMFALAIYDLRKKKIFVARDRMGEKPLYFCHRKGFFAFASEVSSLVLHPEISKDIDHKALTQFFVHNYIPGSHCIYQDIKKLKPGRVLTYNLDNGKLKYSRFWNVFESVSNKTSELTYEESRNQLSGLLNQSIQGQLISDVPLGCFLSGGIDSSLIAATMSEVSSQPVKTFTISFREKEFDESEHAKAVAKHLGTEHTELEATPNDCLALLDDISKIYSEPFADASMLPTTLLSRMTKEHVTVALSGDAGDELFLGYDRYRWLLKFNSIVKYLPAPVRLDFLSHLALLPNYKLQMLANSLRYRNERSLYSAVFTGWNVPYVSKLLKPLLHQNLSITPLAKLPKSLRSLPLEARASLEDQLHYLPDDILVKVDRAAMSCSLETRVPLLDHRIVEFANALPRDYKWKGTEQKRILKDLLFQKVPKKIFDRPKSGFAVPLRHWFRHELEKKLQHYTSKSAIAQHGLFDPSVVKQLVDRHQSGKWNHERQLWALLVFQIWYEANHS